MFPTLPRACRSAFVVAAIGFTLLGNASAAEAIERVDFNRQVLPILSDACFRCHGPDEQARKAKLRLDTREGLFRTRNDVTVVAPGKPDESELVLRITSVDEEEMMPPRDAKRRLSPDEIALLKRWVAEGAPWAGHWAFEPVIGRRVIGNHSSSLTTRSPLTDQSSPIDAFIRARLAKENLTPAPEAERARLLRRVTFDLTGLSPTPAEIAAFEADRSPDAYERVVDRLLASPRFGERMAADWLDLARYADTHGYQMDRPRAMWAWRDWVIRAFNRNQRFDEFVLWQLAGDLLPSPTNEQRLATGFNRLHNQNEEGGIVDEEYRIAYVTDRVTTFGTAFLGLTLECARCHDHKYDPITQRDFYSLSAFFQNIDEAGQISYAGFADSMPVPTLLVTTPEQQARLETLRREALTAETRFAQARSNARDAFAAWLADKGPLPSVPAGLVARYPLEAATESGTVVNAVDATKPGKAQETPRFVDTPQGRAAELDGENGFTFPGVGHFTRADEFSLALWLQTLAQPAARAVVLHHSKASFDAGSRGYEVLLENGCVAFGLHYLWPGASLKIVTKTPLPAGTWTHVTVTYDGSSRAAGARIFVNGHAADVTVVRDGLFKDITYAKSEPDLAVGYRFRDNGFVGGRVRDLCVFDRALTALETAQLAGRDALAVAWARRPEQLAAAEREALFDYFTSNVHASTRDLRRALHAAREKQNAFVMALPEAMVMQELPQPKRAFVLERGAYDARRQEVFADTPAVLPPFPKNQPRNRLGLARWLLDPEHSLFARVTVNRFWQQMFGRGLVETSDNFGRQGAAPTHPELLDWLAREFIASGWDVKALLRQIALSRAYRQSSHASPELLARDPQNLLLARGPARRLTGEMLRDQALAASGLLVDKIGGPPVKPYQPPGLWEEIAMGKPKYEQGRGDDLHRRSLYTFWKRTVPPPAMMIFDAAERNVCTVRRQTTSTPLQSLALLNDVQLVEAARCLGERMLHEGGATRDAQLAWAFRLVCSRAASAEEVRVLRTIFDDQRALFAADEKAAAELMRVGEAATDASLRLADRAAATMVAQALLNFDEALMRR
jgi:hypothetical protein